MQNLHERIIQFQHDFKDERKARDRRRDRIPTQAWWLYDAASKTHGENLKRNMKKHAWWLIRQERQQAMLRHERDHLLRGGITKKKSPLEPIRSLHIMNDEKPIEVYDTQNIAAHIAAFFKDKWNATEENTQSYDYSQHLSSKENEFKPSLEDISAAVAKIKHKARIDKEGHAPVTYRLMPKAIIQRLILDWVRSTAHKDHSEQTFIGIIHGYARGNTTANPSLGKIRVIMPQNTMQTIMDILLADRINLAIDEVYKQESPMLFEGGRPYTQVQDITHSLAMLVERGLDSRARAGICSANIKQYYDHLRVKQCLIDLAKRNPQSTNLTAAVIQAMHRLQSQSTLMITCGPEIIRIPPPPRSGRPDRVSCRCRTRESSDPELHRGTAGRIKTPGIPRLRRSKASDRHLCRQHFHSCDNG